MFKLFFKFLGLSTLIALAALALLYFILPKFSHQLNATLIEYWVFSWVLALISFFVVLYIHHQNANRTGFAFLGLVLVKMAIAALYIIPQLKTATEDKFYLMFHFFGAYFLFLFLEARELMVLLNNRDFSDKE